MKHLVLSRFQQFLAALKLGLIELRHVLYVGLAFSLVVLVNWCSVSLGFPSVWPHLAFVMMFMAVAISLVLVHLVYLFMAVYGIHLVLTWFRTLWEKAKSNENKHE